MLLPGPQSLASPCALEFARSSPGKGYADGNILSVGRDHQLLVTRAKVLGISGRKVVSATPQQAETLLASQPFELVVLGHTLSDGELADLAIRARSNNADVRLVLTYLDPRPSYLCKLVDRSIDSWAGPSALLSAIQELLTPKDVRQA